MQMALKLDRSRLPPTTSLGQRAMTEGLIANMVSLGMLREGDGRAPLLEETSANPRGDEVVVFRDFFVVGLRFPVNPVLVDILRLYGMYTHQLTPNAFVRLNLYFWLVKTCGFRLSAEGFAFIHKVHFQPKAVSAADDSGPEGEPQYGCYIFVYRGTVFCHVTAYRNKWEDWTSFWFYHKVPVDSATGGHPLVVQRIENLPSTCPSADIEETEDLRAFEAMLRKVAKIYFWHSRHY